MKVDEILKLIDAGYTKADIDAMTAEPAAEPEQTAEPEETPAQAAEPAAQAPAQTAEPAQATGQDQILEALNRLTNTIIKSNINSTVIQPAERTPEDALAEIISPPKPKARR
jgi:pyruvate/2-oxoglutarate dehydrogenase complex dihydrolipoamide acyltransferase (E2) component